MPWRARSIRRQAAEPRTNWFMNSALITRIRARNRPLQPRRFWMPRKTWPEGSALSIILTFPGNTVSIFLTCKVNG